MIDHQAESKPMHFSLVLESLSLDFPCDWTVKGAQTLRKDCWSSGSFKYGLFATIWSVIWPSGPYSCLGTAQLWQISNVASLRKCLYLVLDCRLVNLHLSGGVWNTINLHFQSVWQIFRILMLLILMLCAIKRLPRQYRPLNLAFFWPDNQF